MDMKCYEFKDGRRLFKWIYLQLILYILSVVISFFKNKLLGTPMVPSTLAFQVIGYLIVIIIFFRNTRTQIFVNETKLKTKRVIHFMSITDIKVTHDIQIITDNLVEVIKLIDLENNYDRYKELLEFILSKIDRNIAMLAGSADELLQNAVANTKQRYSSHKLADGKVELGGWLTYFNVIAYFAVVFGAIAIAIFIAASFIENWAFEMKMTVMYIQIALLFLINYAAVKLLSKRKSSVKYALAALPLSTVILTVFNSVNNIINGTGSAYILLVATGMIMSIITSLLMAKIYIEYVDTFERPKQTLTN